jgi:hypothetical protein
MDLTDSYRIFHPTTALYTFSLEVHGAFSKTDQILGQNISLNKYKKINK